MHVKSCGMSSGLPAYSVRRREFRYVSTAKVKVMRFLRFGPVVTPGVSLNVSRCGMSALVCGAPRVGETVIITPQVTTAPVEILATVRHSTDAGSGFEFYPLSNVAEKIIEHWIHELSQEEEATLVPRAWRFTEN